MTATKLRTHDEAKAWLAHRGVSIAEWARAHGFRPALVRCVLNAKTPCHRGISHQIAVALGLKRGVVDRTPEEARQRAIHSDRATSIGPSA